MKQPDVDWSTLVSSQLVNSGRSLIRDLFYRLRGSDVISFAGGLPDPDLYPYGEIQRAFASLSSDQPRLKEALSYGGSAGYQPLREWIVGHMQALSVMLQAESVMVTSGSQQALDLVTRTLVSPGEKIVVAAPSYLGALQIFRSHGAQLLSVATDAHGPQLAEFEAAIEQGPKFIYLVADFSNPSGESIEKNRRLELIKIARSAGIPIVDDAAYQQLRYDGEEIPPMMALEQQLLETENLSYAQNGLTIHLGSFSKTMSPGLRMGWIAGPPALLDSIQIAKQATDLHSSSLSQAVLWRVVKDDFEAQVSQLRNAYQVKRDHMMEVLQAQMPDSVSMTSPQGGMFVWLTLPAPLESEKLWVDAIENAGVAFIPGSPFFADPANGQPHCRLSFSGRTLEEIEVGLTRLADLFRTRMAGNSQ